MECSDAGCKKCLPDDPKTWRHTVAEALEETRPGSADYRAGFHEGVKHGLAAVEHLEPRVRTIQIDPSDLYTVLRSFYLTGQIYSQAEFRAADRLNAVLDKFGWGYDPRDP